jgi:hypothetical protein
LLTHHTEARISRLATNACAGERRAGRRFAYFRDPTELMVPEIVATDAKPVGIGVATM